MTVPSLNSRRHVDAARLAAGVALVAVVLATGMGGCGSPPTTTKVAPDSVHLSFGVRTLVPGTILALTFDTVTQDSRCPPDVVCVWAGELRVRVRTENAAAAGPVPMVEIDEFSTWNAREQTSFGYKLELINQRAPARSDELLPPDSYWIALRVTPLQD